ncbi:hypothetical protein ACFFRE_06255 [Aciditerrimonas ferrireducens]|uniref:Superfamily III holin-X n=1 Tax=Aciditerrimonas ferrireducens TaxID=667306 RepID=A0ABV6C228_9ACTN
MPEDRQGEPRTRSGRPGLSEGLSDLLRLVLDYLKQETVGPLRGLGRFVVFGVLGSVAVAAGAVLLLVAVLRVLQDETGTTFAGDRSWLPYVVVVVLALVGLGVAGWRVVAGVGRRQRGQAEGERGRRGS